MMSTSVDVNALRLPVTGSISVRPVVAPAPGRGADLQMRVTAPLVGQDLPVVVFSHGFGLSMDAYGPLVDFWAAQGFVVVQPTHLDSMSLGLGPDDIRGPRIWRFRIEDLVRALDEVDKLAATIPELHGRVDTTKVAVAGHSYGATTASALLGARVLGPAGDANEDFTDARVRAGVLMCLAGLAGDDLTPLASQLFSFMRPDFDHMGAPALIVAGDADQSVLSTRGPDWWRDAHRLSPGEKWLLTLFGAEHELGGIHAYGTTPQSSAHSPGTVALVQQMTSAYLRNVLYQDTATWDSARSTLVSESEPAGRLDTK